MVSTCTIETTHKIVVVVMTFAIKHTCLHLFQTVVRTVQYATMHRVGKLWWHLEDSRHRNAAILEHDKFSLR